MWKKKDDAEDLQPEFSSKERPELGLLGDALAKSLTEDPFQKGDLPDPFQKEDLPVVPQSVFKEDSNQPLASPAMNTYTEAVTEFTKSATAFIEQLPLLAKARDAYEEAMRASKEVRTALDASDENLRTLMTQLEQRINLKELKPTTDKKPPEPANQGERIKETAVGGGRAFRWP